MAFNFLQTFVELLTLSRLDAVSDVGFDASNVGDIGVDVGFGLGESFIETFLGLADADADAAAPFSTGFRKLDFRMRVFSGPGPIPGNRCDTFSSMLF